MEKNQGYDRWDIKFEEKDYTELFDKSDIVYLTAESDNTLETLEPNKVYIIGGLVDRNQHKVNNYINTNKINNK